MNGGDPLYLCYWMRQSGLADLFPSLSKMVYVGLSAGSMVMAPNIGEWFVGWKPPTGGDKTLGMVDFAIFPHVDHQMLPYNTMAYAERWAADIPGPAYAIDDETAIEVVDGTAQSRLRGALETVYALMGATFQYVSGGGRRSASLFFVLYTPSDSCSFDNEVT